jgi:hypothetical protein
LTFLRSLISKPESDEVAFSYDVFGCLARIWKNSIIHFQVFNELLLVLDNDIWCSLAMTNEIGSQEVSDGIEVSGV